MKVIIEGHKPTGEHISCKTVNIATVPCEYQYSTIHKLTIIIIIIIINEKINVAFSQKTARTHNTHIK